MKRLACLAIILIGLVFAYGCGSSPAASNSTTVTKYTSFAGVTLGMTLAQTQAVLGTPTNNNAIASGTATGGRILGYNLDGTGSVYLIGTLSAADKLVQISFSSSSLDTSYTVAGIYTTQTGVSALATLGTPSHTDTSFPLEIRYYFSDSNAYIGVSKLTDKVYSTGIYDPTFWGY